MFHHLPVKVKEKALREIHRVLKPEGRLFLYDFAAARTLTSPLMFLLLVWIAPTRYQLLGKLPALIRRCGFEYSERIHRGLFFDGTLSYKQGAPARTAGEPDPETSEMGRKQP
jgi:SAM-dependent methyltransferase